MSTALVASVLVVLGVYADGYPVTDVNLARSTVWVTKKDKRLVGRVNRQIDEINSSVKSRTADFDVLQDGDSVLVVDRVKNEVRTLDVASVLLAGRLGIPTGSDLSFAGGVLAVADPISGDLWAGTPESMAGLDPTAAPALLRTAAGIRVATSVGGSVFAVAPGSDALWSASVGDTAEPAGWSTDDQSRPIAPEPARLFGGSLTRFLYTVAAGSATATGVIRFDVRAAPDTTAPPIVTPDVAYLVPGRTLVIDPLANDGAPERVDGYSNYGPANAGNAMCRGNPGDSLSMPGGRASQTLSVPGGVGVLNSALVQIDPDAVVTAHLALSVNGRLAVQASAIPLAIRVSALARYRLVPVTRSSSTFPLLRPEGRSSRCIPREARAAPSRQVTAALTAHPA